MSSRRKGRTYENQAAKLVGGHRISRAGMAGSDIVDLEGNEVEVKYRKTLWADLESWLAQRDRQGSQYLMVRRARGRWQVIIDAELFVKDYLGG